MCAIGMVIALIIGILVGHLARRIRRRQQARQQSFASSTTCCCRRRRSWSGCSSTNASSAISSAISRGWPVRWRWPSWPRRSSPGRPRISCGCNPTSLREAGMALGADRGLVIRAIIWKASRTGLVTGGLLGFARISGETAPLLFTALGNPVHELQPDPADGVAADHNLPVRPQRRRQLAPAGLGGGADHRHFRPLCQYHRARPGDARGSNVPSEVRYQRRKNNPPSWSRRRSSSASSMCGV